MAKSMKRTTSAKAGATLVRATNLEHQILVVRGQKVMLASDLAAAYGVQVKRLNEAVRRATPTVFRRISCFNSRGKRRRPLPIQGRKLRP
jgi:hypothetical protein